ncbi:glycosyltransferase [Chitinophaga japonensis]|uniref:Glycosyl transferase family 1 n=1 Tax=Chitinophaga japonensis TaxID=104662 RepID=A0A562T172_CHIJA|nr:glycosyltransferase [Chitinophaga japonensis]TWI86934.1 glycosyl transferase family 1 [Chitinophaga japonensis]
MKVVINASTIRIGGGLQATHSFVDQCRELNSYTFHVFLSERVAEIIDTSLFPGNFFFYRMRSGSASAKKRRMMRRELAELESRIRPDVVLTVYGPSYWRPKAVHVCGYAKGQYIYKDSPLYQILSFKQLLLLRVKEYLHVKSFRKDCDAFIVETEDVRERLMKLIPGKPIYTVANTFHQLFDDSSQWSNNITLPASDAFSLLTVSANYLHKNLRIIPAVIDYLVKTYPGFKFRFVLTVGRQELSGITDFHNEYVVLLGKVDVHDCPNLYRQVDALFLPTLVECFSVSYVEAMKMNKVILTSDLPFATGVCRDAALYFNPLSPEDIGDVIYKVAQSPSLREELLCNGKKQLARAIMAKDRVRGYMNIIKKCYESRHNEQFLLKGAEAYRCSVTGES